MGQISFDDNTRVGTTYSLEVKKGVMSDWGCN